MFFRANNLIKKKIIRVVRLISLHLQNRVFNVHLTFLMMPNIVMTQSLF